ncbi:MAG: O-antigen polymerase [Burkholderiales bacterium]|nr:MAG: O-antigen polymerase [Burkholderiales bacterium]
MPLRDIVLTGFIFGALVFVFKRPWIGMLLWHWIGLMNPHRSTWSFARDLPFAQVVGLTTGIAFLLSPEKKRFPVSALTMTLIAFIVWVCITTIFALYPDSAVDQLKKFIKVQLGVLLTLFVMQDKERILWLVRVVALSIAFYGVKGGLFTLRTGGAGMVLGPYGSYISGNTEIALAITMVAPLLYYMAQQTEQRWLRWGLYGALGLCAIAVIGSYSRGGLLAIIAMVFFLWLKSRRKALLLLLLPPVLLLGLSVMPERWFERMGTIATYQEDSSALGRLNAWAFAFNLARDRPITGGGFQAFKPSAFERWAPEPERFHDSHSIWFGVLGEHGYVGLSLFMLFWGFVWRTASKIIQASKDRDDLRWAGDLAAMIQVSLVGYFVGGSFLGLAYWDYPYLLAAMLALTHMVVSREVVPATEPAPRAWPPSVPVPPSNASKDARNA